MEKILSEILGSNVQFSPILIVPVVLVFVGAVSVFIFGLRQPPVQPKSSSKKTPAADSSQKKTKRKEQQQSQSGSNNKSKAAASTVSGQNGSVSTGSAAVKTSSQKAQAAETKVTPQREQRSQKSNEKASVKKSVTATPPNKKDAKKDKQQKKEKPVDFDDGEWQTVGNKKSKKIEDTNAALAKELTAAANDNKTKEQQKNAKNQKQLKEQANKSKKEKEATEAKKNVKAVAETTVTIVPTVNQEVVVDSIFIAPVAAPTPASPVKAKSQPKPIAATVVVPSVEVAPKLEEIVTPVSNVAFDELGDAWTEAKAPKKSKKRARKE